MLILLSQSMLFFLGRNQILQSYKTPGKIIVLYVVIVMLLSRRWEVGRSWT